MRVPSALLCLAILAVTVVPSPAAAQDRRPSRALFQSGAGTFEQELTASGAAGAGYDTNSRLNAVEAGIQVPTGGPTESSYSILSGGLNYAVSTRDFGLGLNGNSSRRDYYASSNDALSTHNAGIGISFTPSSRTRFGANQTVTYQPFSLYSLFPQAEPPPLGEATVPPVDYYLAGQSYLSYGTSATFSRQLSRRATLSLQYDRTYSDMPTTANYLSQTGSVRFTRTFTKGLGLRLGYGYTGASYDNSEGRHAYHSIDSGVDYNRTLSLSRRTTFSFSTGGSVVVGGDSTSHFVVIGNAALHHEIGRTWNFTAGYDRNVQFLELSSQPIQYQTLSAQLRGLLSRRFSLSTGFGATGGNAVGGSSRSGFGDLYSSSNFATALNRYLNLNVNYSLHWYSYGSGFTLSDGITSNTRRQTLSATIGAWAPLVQRGRKRDAAR
jgi:hypothetical protein